MKISYISLLIFLFTCKIGCVLTQTQTITPANLNQCRKALGMQSGDIEDDRISVSNAIETKYGKEQARLSGDSAWVTYAAHNQWIQVNLEKPMYVSGIQTQGQRYYKRNLWISKYKIRYKFSTDSNWKWVMSEIGTKPQIFGGNINAVAIETRIFPKIVIAQVIQLIPTDWPRTSFAEIALRMELIGCNIEEKSGCGGPKALTQPTGSIQSMNYPHTYDNNANCEWIITAPLDKVISLQVEDGFALEPVNGCQFEYLELIDVIGGVEKSLGKFCGNIKPADVTSTENILKARFMTDHYESDTGFRATYKFVNGSGCGGRQDLREVTGQIQSLNYPNYYNNSMECIWDIYARPSQLLELTFDDFHLFSSKVQLRTSFSMQCYEDKIQIISVPQNRYGIVNNLDYPTESYCGKVMPPSYTSESNHIRVLFTTDQTGVEKGFRASYQAIQSSGCGGRRDLRDPSGTIKSLNYPKNYTNDLQCEWNIISKPNQDIEITFLDFQLEEDRDCKFDYVSIYDGRSKRHLLGKYCQHGIRIQPLVAYSGVMKVIFSSDSINQMPGFEAAYVMIQRKTPTTTVPSTNQQSTTNIKLNSVQTTAHKINSVSTTTTKTEKIMKSSTLISSVVTKEMGKWIIVGLATVGGLIVIGILFGIVFCCKSQFTNTSLSLQGSFRNANNSSVVQNHAYDFSVASTNHSIRSRQLEPEPSIVSETFSNQETLRQSPSRESHIYFSIEEFKSKNKKPKKIAEVQSGKVSFKKGQGYNIKPGNQGSEEPSEEDDEGDFYEVEEVEDSGNENNEVFIPAVRTSRCNTMEREKLPRSPAKVMVENILYESADSIDE